MKEPNFHTRREFLRSTLLGGALTWTVPGFIQSTLVSLQAAQPGGRTGKYDPVLIVLQLAGGNDGLNTVIPYDNDHYQRARPQIGLKKSGILTVADGLGFHPAMAGMKTLFDEGNLSVVHGVGYPNPNRSHFRSTEIWQTASDADRVENHGWIGRYFDNQCNGCNASSAICIGSEAPQAFAAKMPRGVTLQNPEQFRLLSEGESEAGEQLFRQMNNLDQNEGSSIGGLVGYDRKDRTESPVDFLERTALDAEVSSERIRDIASRSNGRGSYPATRLGRELELVSKLIAGGMTTRVYYVSHGGFDTHTNQAGTHERLLREMSDTLLALTRDLKAQGNLDRVMVMTFSEFGRRVEENASGGTDHGAAAPLFVIGGNIRPGFTGALPSLKPTDLDEGDIKHTTDFRSVYATVLEKHLKAPSKPILGNAYPILPIVAS